MICRKSFILVFLCVLVLGCGNNKNRKSPGVQLPVYSDEEYNQDEKTLFLDPLCKIESLSGAEIEKARDDAKKFKEKYEKGFLKKDTKDRLFGITRKKELEVFLDYLNERLKPTYIESTGLKEARQKLSKVSQELCSKTGSANSPANSNDSPKPQASLLESLDYQLPTSLKLPKTQQDTSLLQINTPVVQAPFPAQLKARFQGQQRRSRDTPRPQPNVETTPNTLVDSVMVAPSDTASVMTSPPPKPSFNLTTACQVTENEDSTFLEIPNDQFDATEKELIEMQATLNQLQRRGGVVPETTKKVKGDERLELLTKFLNQAARLRRQHDENLKQNNDTLPVLRNARWLEIAINRRKDECLDLKKNRYSAAGF